MTRVVTPGEGHVFHNRLTHSLEVAQIARRLAERLWHDADEAHRALLKGHLEPDVVEAAALAHDLGHPPFGHAGETALNGWARRHCPDGFEGNAQTFRILTRLDQHDAEGVGLNLTRATLRATLKYPWLSGDDRAVTHSALRKFSVYDDDRGSFDWVCGANPVKSLECVLMDKADGLAYSLHDFADLSLAGLIPSELLAHSEAELLHFLERWEQSGRARESVKWASSENGRRSLRYALEEITANVSYARRGGAEHRRAITLWQSETLTDYFNACKIVWDDVHPRLVVEAEPALEHQLKFLQRAVWHYVIEGPLLATQQHGQRRILVSLLEALFERGYESDDRARLRVDLVPTHLKHIVPEGEASCAVIARACVDVVASLSEAEVLALHRRLSGNASGTVRAWEMA